MSLGPIGRLGRLTVKPRTQGQSRAGDVTRRLTGLFLRCTGGTIRRTARPMTAVNVMSSGAPKEQPEDYQMIHPPKSWSYRAAKARKALRSAAHREDRAQQRSRRPSGSGGVSRKSVHNYMDTLRRQRAIAVSGGTH